MLFNFKFLKKVIKKKKKKKKKNLFYYILNFIKFFEIFIYYFILFNE